MGRFAGTRKDATNRIIPVRYQAVTSPSCLLSESRGGSVQPSSDAVARSMPLGCIFDGIERREFQKFRNLWYIQPMVQSATKKLSCLLERRGNSFGFLRFFLALTVIFSHCYPLGGLGPEQINSKVVETYGTLAVSGFFVISGFLIAASYASSSSVLRFFWHRVLRIMPGFWTCLLAVAIFLGPLQYYAEKHTFSGYYSLAKHFVSVNVWLRIHEYNIGDLMAKHPHPMAWVGTLWSLIYEFHCYVLVGILGFFAVLRSAKHFVLFLYFISFALFATELMYPGGASKIIPWFSDVWMHKLSVYFLAGMVAYVYREQIVVEHRLAFGAAVLVIYSLIYSPALYTLAAMIAVPYLLLYAAATLPLRDFDKRGDYSYGMYLYGFPVQQLLVSIGVNGWGFWAYFLASTIFTLPLALFSYYVVERPCLKLKHLSWSSIRPAASGKVNYELKTVSSDREAVLK